MDIDRKVPPTAMAATAEPWVARSPATLAQKNPRSVLAREDGIEAKMRVLTEQEE
jgi:hypothetical protein